MDAISAQRIALLHPKVRKEVEEIIKEIDKALTGRAKIRISQGLRTFAEQDALYAQGRTDKKGPIVTNAKGGQSIHNYGLAVDFVLIIDNTDASWAMNKDWDDDKINDWTEVVNIFKKYGWAWGGNWNNTKDYPHFDKSFNNTWQQLLAKKNAKQIDAQGYVII